MRPLFLAPHNDDETLFAAYTILRHRPHVLVCLRSYVQAGRLYGQRPNVFGPDHETREIETGAALGILGTTWEQLPVRDDTPDWDALRAILEVYADDAEYGGPVFAPAYEEDGHEHHNTVAELAGSVWPEERIVRYMTYRRGHHRSEGVAVPFEPGWPGLKLRALACYRSQLELPDCFPWFNGPGVLQEWMLG